MSAPGARLVDHAIRIANGADGEAIAGVGERLTYRQLVDLAERTATALRAAGLRPGARVAFLGSPGPAFLASQFGTHLAGGAWLGLNPRYTATELRHPLADAEPSLVVVDVDHDPAALIGVVGDMAHRPLVQPLHRLSDLTDVPGPLPPPSVPVHADIALIVYTSGTTGVPKGAMLTHAGMLKAGRLYVDRYAHPGMRTLVNLPINHVGALVDLTTPAIMAGGTLIAQRQFDPVAILDIMREERVSMLGQVPAMLLAIDAAAPFDTAAFPHLRHVAWSGAAMPRSWIEQRIDGPAELSTCYGQTECTGSCTFTEPGAAVEALADTVGRPAEAGMVSIDRGDGDTGEILVRGPLLMAGYLNRPTETREAIDGGWLRTGDLGTMAPDGSIRLVGRLKEMFKSGGYNVYPREVETSLEAHPAVAAAAVIGVPDDRWGEVGWAFVIRRSGADASTLEAFARERLANFKLPKRYVVADELPLLPIGKIDKLALRRAVEDGEYV